MKNCLLAIWIYRGWYPLIVDCLSGNILLIHRHLLPRGQYTPECRKGLGQDVSSADEIGIACVIAGDTAEHLSLAVAPIVLTTSGTCSGGASRIDGYRQDVVATRQVGARRQGRLTRPFSET